MLKSVILCLLLWHEMCQFSSHAHPGSTDTRVLNLHAFVSPKTNDTYAQTAPGVINNFNITQIFYVSGPLFVMSPGTSLNLNSTDKVSSTGLSRSEGNRRLAGASPQARLSQSETTTSTAYRRVPEGYLVLEGIGAHKLHIEEETWSVARQICIAEGGDLAVIRSIWERNMLTKMLEDIVHTVSWIGYRDKLGKKNWTSVFDEPLENVQRILPSTLECCYEDYRGPLCVALESITEMHMNWYNCDKPLPFLCKIETI